MEGENDGVMDVFVARQPIFDLQRNLYGYELLYRKGTSNFYEGEDDNASTVEVINNSFLVMGFNELTENTRGFINFSEKLLLMDVPKLLPKQKVVIEILERVCISEEVLLACRHLKALGYILALDDYVIKPVNALTEALIDMVDIIKVLFPLDPTPEQMKFLRKHRNRVQLLAERVETKEEFERAKKLGFKLFQGYYFSKPVVINARDIDTFKSNTAHILEELSREEPNFRSIASIFEQDTGLSYKLLKLANSAYFSSGKPVKSIQQALVQIGTTELTGWIYLLFLRGIQSAENREMIKNSIIRGKLMSLLCNANGKDELAGQGLFVGIFSSLDVIVNQSMESVLQGLPLLPIVKDTLLKKETELSPYLRIVCMLEDAGWDMLALQIAEVGLEQNAVMKLYLEAIHWQQQLPI